MMVAKKCSVVLVAGLVLAACASAPVAKKQVNLRMNGTIEQNRANADVQQVERGLHMILDGHVQAAIDGPFDAVVKRYEAEYGQRQEIYFSARGIADGLLYAALPTTQESSQPVVVLGPAWSMAYWGRGYAYNEMARYDDALVELKKALALAPFDAQYNVEIGYTYQQLRRWNESLEHFKSALDYASLTLPDDDVKPVTCKAFRGQGYDLVELHRYAEARAAYRRCLKLMPGEQKSMDELKYIDEVEAGAKAT